MNTPTIDIKDLLEDSDDLDLTFKTNLFVGREPTDPSDVVTIFDAPSRGPALFYDRGVKYFYSAFQIRTRSANYNTGLSLAQNIQSVLHGRGNEVINGTYYSLIESIDDPFLLDWDENNRARFVNNFQLQRRADEE